MMEVPLSSGEEVVGKVVVKRQEEEESCEVRHIQVINILTLFNFSGA